MKNANKIFRDNLLRYMKEAGMCDTELSQRLNFSRTAAHKYTSGKSMPSITTMWMIAKVLGTTMDSLMDGYTEDEYYEGIKI